MAEMMLFPETWEEFEKQYGFYDSKQVYMYGNTRLIPSFRVQQWLEHLKYKQMAQTEMLFDKTMGGGDNDGRD